MYSEFASGCERCWGSDHTISNCKINCIIMFHKNTFRGVILMEFELSFAKYYHVPTSTSCRSVAHWCEKYLDRRPESYGATYW